MTTPANEVYLGLLRILVGTGSTTFNVGEYNTTGQNTVTYTNGDDLDLGGPGNTSTVFTPVGTKVTSFTINATPEPASLGVLALGSAGLLLRRRRSVS